MTTRPATAADLGLMAGPPPAETALVTLANWQDPPFNRWGFQHVRDLIPTARIARGEGRPGGSRARSATCSAHACASAAGRMARSERLLEDTYTDGFLVLHRGRVVTERYRNGLTPSHDPPADVGVEVDHLDRLWGPGRAWAARARRTS